MFGLELLFLGIIGGAVAAVTADNSNDKDKKKEKDDSTGCGGPFALSRSTAFDIDDVLSKYRPPVTPLAPSSSLLSNPVLPALAAPKPFRPTLYEPIEPLRPRLLPDPAPLRPAFEISSHSTSYDMLMGKETSTPGWTFKPDAIGSLSGNLAHYSGLTRPVENGAILDGEFTRLPTGAHVTSVPFPRI